MGYFMYKIMFIVFIISISICAISGMYIFISKNQDRFPLEAIGIILGFVGIIVSIRLTGVQINHSVKLAREQQQISRLNDIQQKSSQLKALQMELENNYNGYLKYVLPMKETMLSGKTTHHFFQYRTSELQPNLSNFTLAYNTFLLNRVSAIYDMCDEANLIFEYVRSGQADHSKIKDYWAYLYDKHDKLLKEWKKVISEVGEAANNYEPISLLLDRNASEIGAQVGAAVDQSGQSISIINYGGIGAEKIRLVIEFDKQPEQEYVRELPYLRRQTAVNFSLFTPRYPEQDISGKLKLYYKTAGSEDIHTLTLGIRWDPTLAKWLQEGATARRPEAFASFAVGNILQGTSEDRLTGVGQHNVELSVDETGRSLIVSNTGDIAISKVMIQNLFGQLDGWRDYESQKFLSPGESISIQIPEPTAGKPSSLSGYIYFQAEGQDDLNYKVFSYEWNPDEKRWVNQLAR